MDPSQPEVALMSQMQAHAAQIEVKCKELADETTKKCMDISRDIAEMIMQL